MNKIMEAGYGKVYAKKTAAAGGRPKTLVEILFKIHCKWSLFEQGLTNSKKNGILKSKGTRDSNGVI